MDDDLADKALGHDVKGAEDAVVDLLLALDPAASRYGLDEHTLQLPHRERHWRLECRYMATGDPNPGEAAVASVVEEARNFVDGCIADLWSDGALTADSLL